MRLRRPERADLDRALAFTREKLRPRWAKAALVVLVLLIAFRLALPTIVKVVINDRLANLEGYHGHVEDVDIALWRGAYELNSLNIVKLGGDMPSPFFSVDEADIHIDWWALFDGEIVAEITLSHPMINFVVSGGDTQAGEGNDWRQVVDDIVPITISRLEVHEGEITYADYTSSPPVSLRLSETEAVASGLSTRDDPSTAELPARLDVYANAMRTGRIEAHMNLDPWDEQPTFDLDLALEHLQAQEVDDMLSAYAGVDAEAGRLFLYAEINARNGSFEGYVKPMAEGLSIFRFGEDGDVIDVFGDFLLSLVLEVFENHGTDRFAVRVPVRGTFEHPSSDPWEALASILYNTFIEAISHGVENTGGWRREPPGDRHAAR